MNCSVHVLMHFKNCDDFMISLKMTSEKCAKTKVKL